MQAAHTFDVTGSRPAGATWRGKESHWWPTSASAELDPAFFGASLEGSGQFDVEALRARWPAGETEER